MGATKPSFLEKWEADGTLPKKLEAIKSHAQWNTPHRMIARGLGVTYSTFKSMREDSRVEEALQEGYLIYTAKLQDWADTSIVDIVTHPEIPPTTKYDYLMKHLKRFDKRLGREDILEIAKKDSFNPAQTPANPASSTMFTMRNGIKEGDNLGSEDV